MMQFPPLDQHSPIGSEDLGVRYWIVSSVIISKVQLGIFLQEYVCVTVVSPASHRPGSSSRCQLPLTKLISHWGSSSSLLVITQPRELSVVLSLMGRGEDKRCEAQSQIPIVILCRRSVNELV